MKLNPTHFAEVTRLHRSVLGSMRGTLVVTAAQQGEGCSLIATLLARRSAEEGKKTLLIDLNLKNNNISTTFSLRPQIWNIPACPDLGKLSELAVEQTPLLDVLPAPSDAESIRWLCEAEQAKHLFTALAKQYDHIVVDTTPLSVTNRQNADPVLLASAADKVLFVILAGVTPRQKIRQAVQHLQTAGAHLVGVVVNDKANQSSAEVLQALVRGIKQVNLGLGSWLEHRTRGL